MHDTHEWPHTVYDFQEAAHFMSLTFTNCQGLWSTKLTLQSWKSKSKRCWCTQIVDPLILRMYTSVLSTCTNTKTTVNQIYKSSVYCTSPCTVMQIKKTKKQKRHRQSAIKQTWSDTSTCYIDTTIDDLPDFLVDR
jgi:hypothetical protein